MIFGNKRYTILGFCGSKVCIHNDLGFCRCKLIGINNDGMCSNFQPVMVPMDDNTLPNENVCVDETQNISKNKIGFQDEF